MYVPRLHIQSLQIPQIETVTGRILFENREQGKKEI